MDFELLANTIGQTHQVLQQSAAKAINLHLTVRNWLIGYYIVEYEQKGMDRAAYGEKLIEKLAQRLNNKSLSNGNLKIFRQFYAAYPQLAQPVSNFLNSYSVIRQSVIGEFKSNENPIIGQSAIGELTEGMTVPPETLMSSLSFTHLVQLMPIKDILKRTFYEMECIKGNWSIRELVRQINSLYFERAGLSQNPKKLTEMIAASTLPANPTDVVKSVYAFEFLGLQAKDVVEESDLETLLLDHLMDFLLEMGHGFCLEARQKRILIGDEYYFIDLVFYHRILKCHVLLELKVEEFNHTNIGQLNTYINYYKNEEMRNDDNPPIGILLVTNKNEALVQYATAGLDNHLFVSKYLIELPDAKQLQDFVNEELKQL